MGGSGTHTLWEWAVRHPVGGGLRNGPTQGSTVHFPFDCRHSEEGINDSLDVF